MKISGKTASILIVDEVALAAAAEPWERFADEIRRDSCTEQAYRQRSRAWLNRRKGRGSK